MSCIPECGHKSIIFHKIPSTSLSLLTSKKPHVSNLSVKLCNYSMCETSFTAAVKAQFPSSLPGLHTDLLPMPLPPPDGKVGSSLYKLHMLSAAQANTK